MTHMTVRTTSFIIGSIALFLVGAACQKKTTDTPVSQIVKNVNKNENINAIVPSLSNARIDSSANVNGSVLANGNVNGNTNSDRNENENRAATNTSNDMISVEAPSANAAVSSPFAVTGTTNATAVFVRVKNAAGTALFTESASIKEHDFSINLSFEFSQTTTGTIEVFTRDVSEREADLIAIPVTFTVASTLPDSVGTMPLVSNTNNATNENVNADDQNVNSSAY